MPSRKRIKAKKLNLFQKTWKLHNNLFKWLFKWFLRSLLVVSRRGRQTRLSPKSGFVLPTATMVLLVAVLLTTAMLFRSFDRSSNASNTRVNQAVLKAAEPGLDRARAKIDALFNDPTLPRETPSDLALYNAIQSNRYNLGDEARLKLVSDIDEDNTIEANATDTVIENDETLTTAWKFPVDTDNNGKFDSYTLYGIYFRSPSRDANGKFNRSRNSLEARTPPMSGGILGNQCANLSSTSASLIGDSSWYKTGEKLTKSVFVYTATVPITNAPSSNYEVYKGNKGFSALEFQQDRSRLPLTNNAAIFQDDLELTPDSTFQMNGRIFTNANLLIGGHGGAIRLYQVSSKNSCFYKQENSKITVGGNVGTGNLADSTDRTAVTVDLFKGVGNDPDSTKQIDGSNRSTTSAGGSQVGYNDAAYNQRIAFMKQAALSYSTTNPPTATSVDAVTRYPEEVKKGFRAKITAPGGSSLNAQEVLAEQIETYLKDRTRRVPYAEVAFGADAIGSVTVFASGIEPPATWREPTDTNTGLSLNTANLKQTQPEKQKKDEVETELGDRVYVGNNLPAYWKNDSGKYVTGPFEKQLLGSSIKWTNPNTELRYRNNQVVTLPDVGESGRDGYWEEKAAEQPATNLSDVGGLRVVTGAGIYVDEDSSTTVGTPSFPRSTYSFLPKPALGPGILNPSVFTTSSITTGNENIAVWSDTMPMTGGADEIAGLNRKGDLQMRATAIYHYKDSSYTDTNYINRTPTACISSYYNPTNAIAAKNSLNAWSANYNANGRSNNGIVYSAPYTTDSGRTSAVSTYRTKLNRQARLIFPSGRVVNQPLRNALAKIDASGTRSLADNSAIDTAICALKILDGTLTLPSGTPPIPHGAIKEAAFLDARQVKAIDKTATNYDLELEQRQPLEVRVTDIDMRQLATTTIGSATRQEYLLPNSGIIYATRNDALLDLSDTTAEQKLLSPTDFKLDSTRRPNGIRLINGSNLERDDDYREEEKGLILVTNLPAYIQGDFNLHQKSGTTTATEEFTDKLDDDWSDFYTRTTTPDNDFACRKGQTGCGSNGDQWRPATIISDSITALSNSFVDGFRDQGDYDLRNNADISVTQTRKNNGFWDNSFITSADWAGSDGFPSSRNSYLTNGVEPIQRRATFPEYLMEVCTKLPVSACKVNDWYVNPATSRRASDVIGETFAIGTHKAGTTAVLADSAYRRYPRRLAVLRRTDGSGRLILTEEPASGGKASPIPIGIDSFGNIRLYPYQNYTKGITTYNAYGSSNKPRNGTNPTLWYRTSSDANDPTPRSNRSTDRYSSDFPLQYMADTGLLSPETICVKKSATNAGSLISCPQPTPSNPNPWDSTIANLNLPTSDQASGYAVCVFASDKGATKKYKTAGDAGFAGTCPGANNDTSTVSGVIKGTRNILGALTSPSPVGILTSVGGVLTASADVNVYTLPGGFNNGAIITLTSVSNPNAVFVLKAPSGNFNFGANRCGSMPSISCNGVKVILNGVEPNNVFWILDNGNVKFEDVNTTAQVDANPTLYWGHQIKGTVFGGSSMHMGNNTEIEGRLLGNSNAVQFTSGSTSNVTAIVTSSQPLFIPVLQIHSPEGSPSSSLAQGSAAIKDKWLQIVANNTTVNAIFAAGNSPSRPQEESAGLHNFVRFLENWSGKTLNIKGSFMQFKRSAYATAPFATVLRDKADDDDGSLSIFRYSFTQYKTNNGTPAGTLPYYDAPTQQWGYDVGLLSHPLDKFAQRFTQQQTSPPDEFFREISRDDSWVQTLLCAAQGSGTSYTYAVDASERPTNCKAIGSYND